MELASKKNELLRRIYFHIDSAFTPCRIPCLRFFVQRTAVAES